MRRHHKDKQVTNLRFVSNLEFIALRTNVVLKRRELVNTGAITPSENSLLEELQLATIGAMNERKQICSKAELDLTYLSNLLGYKKPDKIWTLLKNLEMNGYILREKTQYKKLEIIGLNPEVFGQLLINIEHKKEQTRGLKLVVDHPTEKPIFHQSRTDESSVHTRGSESDLPMIHRSNDKDQDLTWEHVRELLLRKFPNDARRLDRTYQQISQRGYEQEGKSPFMPQHLPAFFLKRYEHFRSEYSFHDAQSAFGA